MRYLGIDYGTKRIGLALSDETGNFAFPHIVLANKGIARSADTISALCKNEQVGKIVLGDSTDYKGAPNQVMKEIRQFAGELEEKTDLPVDFENEVLTSAEAEREQGRNSMHDASAAAIILRSYLEKQKNLS